MISLVIAISKRGMTANVKLMVLKMLKNCNLKNEIEIGISKRLANAIYHFVNDRLSFVWYTYLIRRRCWIRQVSSLKQNVKYIM